jgi:hypothetical protein
MANAKDSAGSSEITRPIQDFPRDEDGMFIQPSELTPKLALVVEHNRQRAFKKGDYADEFCGDGSTLDENGDYDCGHCNQADGDTCLLVYDDDAEPDENGVYPSLIIDLLYGSCGLWEKPNAGDPELRCNRIAKSVANYGVRKGGSPGHVFGCHECWKKKPSLWKIVDGRVFWCGDWFTTVQHNSCCTTNGAPTEGEYEEKKPDESARAQRMYGSKSK